jgi:RNA polymerase subunit RPABC4/transcription elongation factor Spt4
MANCSNCSNFVQQNETFCGQCGTKTVSTQTTVLGTATTKGNSGIFQSY